MAKLSKKQAEEAIRLKKEEELGYRKIEEELKEEYGEENVPTFSYISQKIKPILEGDKTIDEVFSDEEEKKSDEIGVNEKIDVEIEEEQEGKNKKKILLILWILFFLLVAILLI